MPTISDASLIDLMRMVLAALLGAAIGLERDKHGRAAGLRTHLLVSLGAAVFMILSEIIAGRSQSAGFTADPGRIAAQIVTGIGFLGAGVILKTGINVRGLTTAACLWTAAAIGMAAGAGLYFIAVATTMLALVGLIVLKYFESTYATDSYRALTVVTSLEVNATSIITAVQRKNVKVLSCDIVKDIVHDRVETKLMLRIYHKGITDKLAHGIIASLEQAGLGLKHVRWGRR